MSGTGTLLDPYDIGTAFSGRCNVRPGDTVYLRGGTYAGTVTCAMQGLPGKPIIVKPYPGERPIIDGKFVLSGAYVRIQGLEIYQSAFTDRESEQASTDPTDIGGDTLIDVTGNYIEIVNCLVHDGRRGFGVSASAVGTLIYGNLIYFCGWKNPANYYGHGIYPQNAPGIQKCIVNNMLFDGFGYGLHAYTVNSTLDDFLVTHNTFFDAGILVNGVGRSVNALIGGAVPFANPEVTHNCFYMSAAQGTNLQVGYGTDNTVTNAKINNNYAGGASAALKLLTCIPEELTGNHLYGATEGFAQGDYPGNTYGAAGTWGDRVYLEPNTYDSARAHLTIYNQAEANTAIVDLSILGWTGQIIARNVQDYFNDMQTLAIVDGMITVNMQSGNRTVAAPVGWTAPPSTFPKFGAFVLERVEA